jgi:uncharacterized membrane protein YagU involved in acid resistance
MIRLIGRALGGLAAGAMGTIAMGGTSFFIRRMVEPTKPVSKTHYEAVVEWAVETAGSQTAAHAETTVDPENDVDTDQSVEEPATEAPTLDVETRIRAGELTHIGFGAVWGAIFAVALRNKDVKPLTQGAAAGIALWVGAFEGYMPALGITKSLRQMKPYELARTFACHLVYAVTTFTFIRAFSSNRR